MVPGVPERVDYAPLSGVEILFPSAQLKLCDVPCNINRVSSRLTLSTSHIGKGCDRDTYSVQSQRKICGTFSFWTIPCSLILNFFCINLPNLAKTSDKTLNFDKMPRLPKALLFSIEVNNNLQLHIIGPGQIEKHMTSLIVLDVLATQMWKGPRLLYLCLPNRPH